MSFDGFAERARPAGSEEGQGFSVQEEAPSGVREKLRQEPPDSVTADTKDARDYRVENFSPLDRLMYFSGLDDEQRRAAGFSDDADGLQKWEKSKKTSGRKVGETLMLLKEADERYEADRVALAQAEKERRKQWEAKETVRRERVQKKRVGRLEQRQVTWANENRRDVASTQALDAEYAEFLQRFGYEGTGDMEELRGVRARIESGNRAGLRFTRRSEDVAYDEEGLPHPVVMSGAVEKGGALAPEFAKDGLRILLSEEQLPVFEAFLRKKYALDFAGFTRVRAQVEALYRKEFGTKVGLEERRAMDKKVGEVAERFSQQIVACFTEGETDGHLGKEAGSRPRFQWLQNRLLGVLRAAGAFTRVDFSAGALTLESEGADLAYVEIDSGERASDEEKATAFSRLAMREPNDWGKEFSPRLRKTPGFTEHVQTSVAELALLGVLMQDVGGDVSAYDIDRERGRFTQKTTGEVFSIAADFTRELPKELAQRMERIPALKASVEEVVAHCNIPFEIACLHRLPIPASTRTALAALAEQLQDDTQPLAQLVRRSFVAAFLNPLLAEKEYVLFAERVAACAKQRVFDANKPGVIADFSASTRALVQSAALLGRVPTQEALLDAA